MLTFSVTPGSYETAAKHLKMVLVLFNQGPLEKHPAAIVCIKT